MNTQFGHCFYEARIQRCNDIHQNTDYLYNVQANGLLNIWTLSSVKGSLRVLSNRLTAIRNIVTPSTCASRLTETHWGHSSRHHAETFLFDVMKNWMLQTPKCDTQQQCSLEQLELQPFVLFSFCLRTFLGVFLVNVKITEGKCIMFVSVHNCWICDICFFSDKKKALPGSHFAYLLIIRVLRK